MMPVTIILSIKVQDGVVMASDSAVLHRGHLYANAEKNIQLIKGLPIGVLISGDGAVGSRALISVMQDFSVRAALRGSACFVDKSCYTLQEVCTKLRDYILEVSQACLSPIRSALILSGYSADAPLPETWSIRFDGLDPIEPELVWGEDEYGLSWEGQAGCINRLLGDVPQVGFNVAEAQLAEVSLFNQNAIDSPTDEVDSPMLVTPGMPFPTQAVLILAPDQFGLDGVETVKPDRPGFRQGRIGGITAENQRASNGRHGGLRDLQNVVAQLGRHLFQRIGGLVHKAG